MSEFGHVANNHASTARLMDCALIDAPSSGHRKHQRCYTTTQQKMIKFNILMIKLTVYAWHFLPG